MENKTLIALLVGAVLGTAACDNGGTTTAEGGSDKTAQASKEDIGEVLATVNGLQVGAKDFKAAVAEKMEINERKYPAEQVRGSAKKSTEYES